VVLTNIVLNARMCSFTMDLVPTTSMSNAGPGSYRVIITNAATYPSAIAASFASLTVLTAAPPLVMTLAAAGIRGAIKVGRTIGTAGNIGRTSPAW